MSNWFEIAFAFLFTLGLVVVVHELGHFLFCKLFGVFVKTFSIGIGPKVVRRRWGETEYVISAIPFGGYVKMAGEGMMEEIQDTGTWEERKYPLGTEEGNAEAAGLDDHIPPERHFYNRPAWQRLLVFIAGPLFNLILAFVIYAGSVLVYGVPETPFTRVGSVAAASPAAAAGFRVDDRIVAVDGDSVSTWYGVLKGLSPVVDMSGHPGRAVPVAVQRGDSTVHLTVDPVTYEAGDANFDWEYGLRVDNPRVGLVKRRGPAAELGLQRGDRILSIDGVPVRTFEQIARSINSEAGQTVTVVWERDGVRMEGTVTPRLTEIEPGSEGGRIFMEPYVVYQKVSPGEAVSLGYATTLRVSQAMLHFLGRLISGKESLDAVGGPFRIGKAAGEQLEWGFRRLLAFTAFFSINLFLLNLMPIPVLDGGHVLFLLIEVVRGGRPVPERLQAIATQMGLIVLLLFMTFVFVLDIWKVTGH